MKKAFTITELLVAIGLLAAVLAASTSIFHYSIEAQRTAMATAEIMRTLRAITDQLNYDFAGLLKDGYLVLHSESDANDAVYFFSTGDFQSWEDSEIRSNIARIYFGPAGHSKSNLALDIKLLTPGKFGLDYNDANFAACQSNIKNYEDPCDILSINRPLIDIEKDPNDVRKLLVQNVGQVRIEWTSDSSSWAAPGDKITWFGYNNRSGRAFENSIGNPYYLAYWSPSNQLDWPKALKFTFTLYDSKGILKTGRKFEHIVYIGN
jgi:type II secretory pathway pseudopilin PulG